MPKEIKGVAWYDTPGSGRGRDIWILIHPWYTLWHLSYVVIGAALVPGMRWGLLGWTLLAFALGLGIAGHALDETQGRPLKTRVPTPVLWAVAGVSLAGAAAIGVLVGVRETPWIIPLIIFGVFITLAYNREWGFFHDDIWFGIAWGAFPLLTAYLAQAHTVTWQALLVATFALFYSLAQRKLSMQARFFRRKVGSIEGWWYREREAQPSGTLTKEFIIRPVDLALKLMNIAIVALAIGLLLWQNGS